MRLLVRRRKLVGLFLLLLLGSLGCSSYLKLYLEGLNQTLFIRLLFLIGRLCMIGMIWRSRAVL